MVGVVFMWWMWKGERKKTRMGQEGTYFMMAITGTPLITHRSGGEGEEDKEEQTWDETAVGCGWVTGRRGKQGRALFVGGDTATGDETHRRTGALGPIRRVRGWVVKK